MTKGITLRRSETHGIAAVGCVAMMYAVGCSGPGLRVCVRDASSGRPIEQLVVSVRSTSSFSPFNVLDAAVESDGCARLSIGDETMLHLGIEDIEGRVYGFVLPHPSRTGDEEFAIRFPGQHTDWVVLVEEE